MLLILLCLFIAVVVVQFLYYVVFFGKFCFTKPQTSTPKRVPISVIVCAKNEEENVKNFVPLLAEQNYPDYEIVLIDDASSDILMLN
jgi:cellulose synthase/poly-beta-1,6-N-acetylglucosamine synthase-like glycosyltransferase